MSYTIEVIEKELAHCEYLISFYARKKAFYEHELAELATDNNTNK